MNMLSDLAVYLRHMKRIRLADPSDGLLLSRFADYLKALTARGVVQKDAVKLLPFEHEYMDLVGKVTSVADINQFEGEWQSWEKR